MHALKATHHCLAACMFVLTTLAPGAAIAQCGGWVHDLASYGSGMTHNARSIELLDRDGPGPELSQLVICTRDNRILVRGTHDWRFLTTVTNPEVDSMWAWDPDGPGPGAPRIYLGSGRDNVSSNWYLTSVPWERPGETSSAHTVSDVPGPVLDIITWDPDGSGPERDTLVVLRKDSPSSHTGSVIKWTSHGWAPLGASFQFTSAQLAVEDIGESPDGTPSLLILGEVSPIGLSEERGLMVYDELGWRQVGSGLTDGAVRAVTKWDHDASEATPSQLVACGSFTSSGGRVMRGLARFDGADWQEIPGSIPVLTAVSAARAPGDSRESLLVSGNFTSLGGVTSKGLAAFDGVAWRPAGDIDYLSSISSARMWKWSPRGPQSSPQILVSIPSSSAISETRGTGAFAWDGAEWTTPLPLVDPAYAEQTTWDQDGPGPQRPKLVYSQAQSYDTGLPARLALWDGVEWEIQDPGINMSNMSDIEAWDADGDGPQKPRLAFGEDRAATWGGSEVYVWAWDGESREQLGAGFVRNTSAGSIDELKVVDFDGDGPLPPTLIARGSFTASGPNAANSLAWFDGEQWLPLGNGLTDNGPNSLAIRDMTVMDSDGDGPGGGVLLVVGTFSVVDDPTITNLAAWDGLSWSSAGGPLPPYSHHPNYVTSADPDGAGPQPVQPWMGYAEEYEEDCDSWGNCEMYRHYRGYRWDGHAWRETSSYTWWFDQDVDYRWEGPTPAFLHTLHDPDGVGPRSPVLAYAGGGKFYHIGSWGLPDGLAFVGGPSWWIDDGEDYYDATVLSSLHSFAISNDRAILSYCGDFEKLVITTGSGALSRPARGLARWMVGPPIFLGEPDAELNHTARAVAFTVKATGGGDLTHQWRRNGTPLAPGSYPWGVVHSPDDPVLVLSGISTTDDGEYDCVVTNECGSATSSVVRVPPGPPCAADYTGDTVVDGGDFMAFFDDFGQCDQQPSPCGSLGDPDINGDTTIDILDFLDFLDAFGNGC